MRRFVEEADRGQWTLLPECLDDFIDESNPVRVTAFVLDPDSNNIEAVFRGTPKVPAVQAHNQ
jgi:transposase